MSSTSSRLWFPARKSSATEKDTGAKFQTVSGADDSYNLPFLPRGPYTVTAEAAGFKRYVNGNVRVTTNEREQLDIALELGGLEQMVIVSAESWVSGSAMIYDLDTFGA